MVFRAVCNQKCNYFYDLFHNYLNVSTMFSFSVHSDHYSLEDSKKQTKTKKKKDKKETRQSENVG